MHLFEQRKRLAWAPSVAVVAAALSVWAGAANAQFVPVAGQEYREELNPLRSVSGPGLVGMALSGGDPGGLLHVYLPSAVERGQLRVELDSPDGRFHGTGLYEGSSAGKQWVPLVLLRDNRPSLRPQSLPAQELAVSVRTSTGQPLLVSWSGPPSTLSNATLILQINSRRGDIYMRSSRSGEQKCRRVSSASTVRFDTLCTIAVADLHPSPHGGRYLEILRKDGFTSERFQLIEVPLQ